MTDPEVFTFVDPAQLVQAATQSIVHALGSAILEHDQASFVLTGGSTVRPVYQLLAADYRDAVDWRSVHVFWGDERHVPYQSEQSNYGMARRDMLTRLPIPKGQIHPIPTGTTPDADARNYERILREHFDDDQPAFDLLLLGMGADGHVASLFPDGPALGETERWVAATEAPPNHPVSDRITLTLPAINASHTIIFLVAGGEKGSALDSVLHDAEAVLPAARVTAARRLLWFVDERAAGKADRM